jgi:hypothetical protein
MHRLDRLARNLDDLAAFVQALRPRRVRAVEPIRVKAFSERSTSAMPLGHSPARLALQNRYYR